MQPLVSSPPDEVPFLTLTKKKPGYVREPIFDIPLIVLSLSQLDMR